MASRAVASIALLISLNLLFFNMVTAATGTCPVDALKLKLCANVWGIIQIPPNQPCCSLLGNLVALEAAACLCTAIKVNVLGLNLNVPLDLSLYLNNCGKKVPKGFKCP
ncbi:14 kDa proline-rich protein DC2.15 [Jatropha curcas]|uniref:14 kDa proline-rich protein DC2.15 n=1 Tax=Jatropha curcas TaxID=180498 RepID=UPI0018943AEA|nr:14 kDa proline-rich protein DC2.15 [Jatropha curcas]